MYKKSDSTIRKQTQYRGIGKKERERVNGWLVSFKNSYYNLRLNGEK